MMLEQWLRYVKMIVLLDVVGSVAAVWCFLTTIVPFRLSYTCAEGHRIENDFLSQSYQPCNWITAVWLRSNLHTP